MTCTTAFIETEEYGDCTKALTKFAALVRAQALEDAAVICERLRDEHCAGTKLAENPADWCVPHETICNYVSAWEDAAGAIRSIK